VYPRAALGIREGRLRGAVKDDKAEGQEKN
jgi:hypothetical protein